MKKLSELSGDTLLLVKRKNIGDEVMTKDDLVREISDGDNAKYGMYAYLAIENPASIDKDDLQDWMERLEEQYDQYDDWYIDMMIDLNQSKEAKAFIETVNRLARENMNYDRGDQVGIWD